MMRMMLSSPAQQPSAPINGYQQHNYHIGYSVDQFGSQVYPRDSSVQSDSNTEKTFLQL